MPGEPAFVVLMRVHLTFPTVGSLKGKRAELNRVKALLRDRVGASVAEVANQDAWQRSTLAVAVATGSPRRADQAADAIERALLARVGDNVSVERRVASFSDLEDLG
jgi:uncharacterized protein YlxP (DUF503 family)